MAQAGRVALWSFFLLSISISSLRGDEASQKPSDWERRLEMLRAVPYVGFSEVTPNEQEDGVVFYDPKKAYLGYNLYCLQSTGEIFLIDMHGQAIHRWTYSPQTKSFGSGHAIMLENGDVLVIKEFLELLRLNWNSKLVWKKALAAHHDVAHAPDSSFYVIARSFKRHRGLRVIFPTIVHLKTDGKEIDRWSAYDHMTEMRNTLDTSSFLDMHLDSALSGRSQKFGVSEIIKRIGTGPGQYYDYFHLNAITVIPPTVLGEQDLRFRRGNLLICLRNVNQIAVLEKDTYRILWSWGEGELEWPHHPTMLENGHILIFDNGVQRRYSRVVELDPLTEAIVWEYVAEQPEDFYSHFRGSAQRLPNGNTLICESDRARVFEVTEQGEVVWFWRNPATEEVEGKWERLSSIPRQSSGARRREAVYRMLRIPTAQVDRLMNGWWWKWGFADEKEVHMNVLRAE
ncbi:MAG: hypothetical protein AMJ92_03620 [candidate division Zixibacteria bacterium SM23_81]|nr:MAG: hypothetical protein AMJ92_03620 [candidate division Zixibacteria bacterium SM23_81]